MVWHQLIELNDVHAPSYFVHIGLDDGDSFMGSGLWRHWPSSDGWRMISDRYRGRAGQLELLLFIFF
jgi:uncharacterized protein (DUF2461 family)